VLVLVVESATETAAVALADEDGLLGSVTVARGRRHTESIAPAIETVCRRVGLALSRIDLVGVDIGPGLFTGLRVGVGTAQALSLALGVPVVTATSLEVLAQAVAGSGAAAGRLVVPVVDARRREVFSNRFRIGPGPLAALVADAVWSPAALAGDLAAAVLAGAGAPPPSPESEPIVVVGDGALRYRSVFAAVAGVSLGGPLYGTPPVAALAELCVARGLAGVVVDGASVQPRYLRQADATINWEQRIAPRAATAAGA
jgi:tRNA threonylcarbamoyladenosine biosynthesis protein TsaB